VNAHLSTTAVVASEASIVRPTVIVHAALELMNGHRRQVDGSRHAGDVLSVHRSAGGHAVADHHRW
jgi:hypothetical protein